MKGIIVKSYKINIVLNKLEAKWLKEIMQNPLGGIESERDVEMRSKFWELLNKFDI